jgi:hypothetical protein
MIYLIGDSMKKCKDCSLEKPFEDFYKAKANKDGRQGHCKDCGRLRVARWYEAHRDDKPRKNARVTVSKSGMTLGNNKNWKWRQHMEDRCRRCGFMPEQGCQLTVDHIDRNKENNAVVNLQTLCHNCHALKTRIELVSPQELKIFNLIP